MAAWLLALCVPHLVQGHWLDDPRYPDWAQRGRILYLDGTRATEEHLALVERYKAQGATPFIHAFTPHWPDDAAVVERLDKAGIPVDVRVEGSLFFEDDHIDRFAFIHGRFLPGGWWYNHAWRTNYDWWRLFPESIAATTRRRNGDEKLGYAGHRVTVRREGSPLAPEHRSVRARQIAWLLAAIDPLPSVPMRPYENPHAKDPKAPYPMLGHYAGLWYDNPGSAPSYDVASRAAWEKHFREKFGVEIADPAAHPDPNVRREWARFWADAWADFYLWRKAYQNELLAKRGKPFCHTAGNFSFIAQPHGTAEFWFAKRGCVDIFGPSEYVPEWCRGRFHFLIKAAMAASHGRPAGKFYPNDLQIAESLAVCGTNTYRPEQAEFLAANLDLWANAQPGGRIALLFHVEQSLLESHLADYQALVDQITDLGFAYEVVTEDDLGAELVKQFPLLIMSQTDLAEDELAKVGRYLDAGGQLLLLGDCLIEGPRHYHLNAPPPWAPRRTVAAALADKGRGHSVLAVQSPYPTELLGRAIEMFVTPCFRLDPPDPHVLLNILQQPRGDLTLASLVNYSGGAKQNVVVHVPPKAESQHAGWISRDGGAGMLRVANERLAIPELRYGCTIVLGKDRAAIERIVTRNTERFPRAPLPPDFKWASATQYGGWHSRQIAPDAVPETHTLCRHRVGATDRGGYLFLDALGPKAAKVGEAVRIEFRVLETRYDYVEYWQLIFEDAATGERTVVPIALPADNPHGDGGKLAAATLSASWTPKKAGTYQAFLAYRVTRLHHDGEPFLEPENVPAGYSGNTPANLFLKSQPLLKRPCEDRLRGLAIQVAPE
ncbi:MAG TPA: hypothetical protein PLE19_19390 [Planctomycetota bacterium]|nr:hypothetical protein [Planctomycetota bacterium]HRR81227.1 hypothetical protein [Planctomycetota bacterium]HRT93542.1 hypothetical protein [Planctomycetota bacterium]